MRIMQSNIGESISRLMCCQFVRMICKQTYTRIAKHRSIASSSGSANNGGYYIRIT
ncbi:unnamed protein product [Schistosoma curassoni]|uniref:Uncharacterized protein n=1 Tax=Schistosoma curassoni TaxID=6186 RepID=A0A183JL72_9TREM|nr:unnamed protein product [Schistosoma curassoni]